ncbi:hypothetical protein WG909_08260 [Peptostreptococcaceae bacterium AGR-M142]
MSLNDNLKIIREYIESKDYSKAIDLLLECVNNYKKDHRIYYNLGYCYYEIGKFQLSLDYLSLSLSHNKSNQKTIYLLSLINHKIGFINNAYDYIMQLNKFINHNDEYKNLYDLILYSQKNLYLYYENCISFLNQNNNTVNPNSCFKWLCILNFKMEQYQKAYFNLENYIALNKDKKNLDKDIKNIITKDKFTIKSVSKFFKKNESKYKDNSYYILYHNFINEKNKDPKQEKIKTEQEEFKIMLITLITVIGFCSLLFFSIVLRSLNS